MHRSAATGSDRSQFGAGHGVAFYGADSSGLTEAVVVRIAEAVGEAGVALLVVTPAHREAILASASKTFDVGGALDAGSLIAIDAYDLLDRVSIRGYPDPTRFHAAAGRTIENLTGTRPPVYAYGEMVGVLWKAGQYPAAIRLEQLWNGLCRRFPFVLDCGYPIDVFSDDFEATAVDGVLRAHDHVFAGEGAERLAAAVDRAVAEILGRTAEAPQPHPDCRDPRGPWATLPRAEASILWLKSAWPQRAAEVLERARRYYARSA